MNPGPDKTFLPSAKNTLRRRRTCVYANLFKPQHGGVQEYLHQLCLHLSPPNTLGRERLLVVTSIKNFSPTSNSHYSALALRPPSVGTTGVRARILRAFQLVSHRVRLLWQIGIRPRVIIGDIWDSTSYEICRILRQIKVPYALICYGKELIVENAVRSAELRECIAGARVLVAISRATADLITEITGRSDGIEVILPGVDPTPLETPTAEDVRDLRSALGLPSNSRVILGLGRLVKRKGFDFTLRAFAEIASEFPEVYYLQVGDGEERDCLQELAKDLGLGLGGRVRFLLDVPDTMKWTLYRLCEFFVMPNRTLGKTDIEGFGLVFVEAAAGGKPSIGGRNGGAMDAIVDGHTGRLVDTETDWSELREAMRDLLRNPQLTATLGARARERVYRELLWPGVARSYRENVLCAL